ncbi:MAG: ribose 5-phosphate isomerase B [Flavobacteriales bacterium]|nr:ribose 5-phosphate isomerase B [Flavobacteriales bacterium]
MKKSIAIGGDHAGFTTKELIVKQLQDLGLEVMDKGGYNAEPVDYPDQAHAVAEAVASGNASLGIVICGSGNGVNIVANKHAGIRSALAWNPEVAMLARQHNNANVLAIPARFIGADEATAIVRAFLDASYEGGRHERRVSKIEP